MQYITHESGYAGAIDALLKDGGQLFISQSRDGASSLVRGKTVHTFWNENSLKRKEVQRWATQFGYEPEHATPGRLSRHVLKNVIGLDASQTFAHPRCVKLARDGFHWHFTTYQKGYHPYLIEFDLRSAYAKTLASMGSLLWDYDRGFLSDGGALENFNALHPNIPKWLRLGLIGCISSHRMTFYARASGSHSLPAMKMKYINKIDYGAAFNCVHRAILKQYRLMKQIHDIGGDHIARMHTDSFALKHTTPVEVEAAIFKLLDENGHDYSIKASGTSYFWDLNTGVIGRKCIGGRHDVAERAKDLDVKPKRYLLSDEDADRWVQRAGDYKLNQNPGSDGDDIASNQQLEFAIELPSQATHGFQAG